MIPLSFLFLFIMTGVGIIYGLGALVIYLSDLWTISKYKISF